MPKLGLHGQRQRSRSKVTCSRFRIGRRDRVSNPRTVLADDLRVSRHKSHCHCWTEEGINSLVHGWSGGHVQIHGRVRLVSKDHLVLRVKRSKFELTQEQQTVSSVHGLVWLVSKDHVVGSKDHVVGSKDHVLGAGQGSYNY